MADSCDGVILHLGGSGEAAVDVAKSIYYANKKVLNVVVSSENPKHLLGYLPKIDNKNVVLQSVRRQAPVYHHREAWDTVTNFTTTYQFIKEKYDPKIIWIVCHGFHMERAMAIAKAVYWWRRVQLIPTPCSGWPRYQNPDLVVQDTWRAWVWRFTGILFYWKSLRDTRKPHDVPKSNEIPIERLLGVLPDWMKKALHISGESAKPCRND